MIVVDISVSQVGPTWPFGFSAELIVGRTAASARTGRFIPPLDRRSKLNLPGFPLSFWAKSTGSVAPSLDGGSRRSRGFNVIPAVGFLPNLSLDAFHKGGMYGRLLI
jgi:hypothetical protein